MHILSPTVAVSMFRVSTAENGMIFCLSLLQAGCGINIAVLSSVVSVASIQSNIMAHYSRLHNYSLISSAMFNLVDSRMTASSLHYNLR